MKQNHITSSEQLLDRQAEISAWFAVLINALSKVDFQYAAEAMAELRKRGIVVRLYTDMKRGAK